MTLFFVVICCDLGWKLRILEFDIGTKNFRDHLWQHFLSWLAPAWKRQTQKGIEMHRVWANENQRKSRKINQTVWLLYIGYFKLVSICFDYIIQINSDYLLRHIQAIQCGSYRNLRPSDGRRRGHQSTSKKICTVLHVFALHNKHINIIYCNKHEKLEKLCYTMMIYFNVWSIRRIIALKCIEISLALRGSTSSRWGPPSGNLHQSTLTYIL